MSETTYKKRYDFLYTNVSQIKENKENIITKNNNNNKR